ncbi:MAG TPA: Spy/CpxP family protein refolding chaperone [Burkholderiales bacterium]|nr:Spy/CpxP family protein refolding chaperone [Burkholderiales bacterium]
METSNVERNSEPSKPKRRLVGKILAGGVLAGLLASAAAFVAHAHEGSFGAGCRHMGWRGPGGMSPEAMRERLDQMTERTLTRVNASDDQKARVKQVVAAAAQDLATLRESHRANRQAMMEALSADTIDRERIESIRKAELALAEQASRRVSVALADAAEVLSPDQRRELISLLHKRFERHFDSREPGQGS